MPLGIKQKGILATCNYVARGRGVRKLMQIFEAKKICSDLVLADGEDLSPFRDVSKELYALVRSHSWNGKTERLGLDEVFLDVTDIVAYNVDLLNPNSLAESFFYLSKDDPESGFAYDATLFAGCVEGSEDDGSPTQSLLHMRLLVASHLARHIRLQIEDRGYTSACGISTNKVLAKLAGNRNKPRNQTTLLALDDAAVLSFMDAHGLRQVPGIGARTTRMLEAYVTGGDLDLVTRSMESAVTVGQARMRPDMSPQLLERILGGPGTEKGLGHKVWALLHGVDDTEVKPATDIPTQISIEDTYKGLNEMVEIQAELRKLSASLLRRMHIDLTEDASPHPPGGDGDGSAEEASGPGRKWIAHPKTLRLSTAPKWSTSDGKPYMFGRASRSQSLPAFVFNLQAEPAQRAGRLVEEALLGMFAKLNPAPRGWNLGMLNICVTNMHPAGTEDGSGRGRDISVMFRRQEDVLREFTVYDDDENDENDASEAPEPAEQGGEEEDWDRAGEEQHEEDVADDDDMWEDAGDFSDGIMEHCPLCDRLIPIFALGAHDRFHQEIS